MATSKASEISLTDDVQIIREILFGEQVKLFKERIASLEEAVSSLKKENDRLHKALATDIEARQVALLEKVNTLEENLNRRLETETGDRQGALAALQRGLEDQLNQAVQRLDGRLDANFVQQEALLAALVKALNGYQDGLAAREG